MTFFDPNDPRSQGEPQPPQPALAMIILKAIRDGGQFEPSSPEAMSMGLGICSGGFIALIGLAFGVAGFFTRDRKRGFTIAGLVINGGLLLGVVALTILGLLSKR